MCVGGPSASAWGTTGTHLGVWGRLTEDQKGGDQKKVKRKGKGWPEGSDWPADGGKVDSQS